ncbi:MAG: rRNA maturation RNase YbeY [Paludibacteraceae bacterium]|nr:rRNA maturation RNase YbeY [Paludibacteraceae bacterium]MDD6356984.1 rRNA maturation RNase YbeY [Bacteroidales bacterium]
MISFFSQEVSLPTFDQRKITDWIKKTAAFYGKRAGDISYVFCSDDRILEVNRQFLQHDYYTDVITFDYSEADIVSGDIFISVDTVRSNAEQFGQSYERELHRIIIHGVLHLCGQEDKTPETRRVMTEKEELALKTLDEMQG